MLKEAQEETGNDGLRTLQYLATKMEKTIPTVKTAADSRQQLNIVHDQFHALKEAFCDVTEEQGKQPAYSKAHTLKKEMRTVFHRLWKFQDRVPLRDVHLDLLSLRVQELQNALQTITP